MKRIQRPGGPGNVGGKFYKDTSHFICRNDLCKYFDILPERLEEIMKKAGVCYRVRSMVTPKEEKLIERLAKRGIWYRKAPDVVRKVIWLEPFSDEEVRRIITEYRHQKGSVPNNSGHFKTGADPRRSQYRPPAGHHWRNGPASPPKKA